MLSCNDVQDYPDFHIPTPVLQADDDDEFNDFIDDDMGGGAGGASAPRRRRRLTGLPAGVSAAAMRVRTLPFTWPLISCPAPLPLVWPDVWSKGCYAPHH